MKPAVMSGPVWTRWDLIICLALFGMIAAVFWQVRYHEFITYDDPNYVTENLRVQAGLTKANLAWAFRTTSESNWHPLTWLSHMLDCQWFGLDAGKHHLVNVVFHILNSLLLFVVFKKMTGARWPSAFVAALFALHPLHVESVAWVSERKDVLSAFFWILTMWAYVCYVERPVLGRYLFALLLLALGLMSKPMLVTLPCVLFLLDFWPLGRIRFTARDSSGRLSFGSRGSGKAVQPSEPKPPSGMPGLPTVAVGRLLLEKVPFLALAGISCAATYWAQKKGEAVVAVAAVPMDQRFTNAIISYARYAGKMIWPESLSVFYPYVRTWPAWQVLGALLLLIGATWLAIWGRRNHRYLAVGWFWYLGTLVPVIGLIQAGAQSMADRYTYIPLIGLFVMMAWGIVDLSSRWPQKKFAFTTLALAGVSGCLVLTLFQVPFWKNSVSLFEHALSVTSGSATIHFNLGYGLLDKGRPEEARAQFAAGLQRDPRAYWVDAKMGDILTGQGKFDEAVAKYSEALKLRPDFAEAHTGLALALSAQGRSREALAQYEEALRVKPQLVLALNNRAWILATHEDATLRNGPEAVRCAELACELTGRKQPFLLGTLAAAYAEAGQFSEAVTTAQRAAELALATGQKDLALTNQKLMESYRAGKPYREKAL